MPNHQKATQLNGPMVARIEKCAADTSPNGDGKITIYPPEARGLTALIAETTALREIADEAAYYFGAQECVDGECDHLDDPEDSEPCPVLDERYATADDVIRAQVFEEALNEIDGLLDGTPERDLNDCIRGAIQRGRDVVAELTSTVTRPYSGGAK